jgi:acyl-CoA reductase-like NAD-dependent aldehyde dehydrogenase
MRPHYIAGEWVAGDSAADNINPSDTRDVIDSYAWASVAQAREAVAAAHAAAPRWAASGIQARSEALDTVGTELLARRQALGELLAREEGKTLAEAVGEVVRAGQIFKFFAGVVLRPDGELITSTRPGMAVEVTLSLIHI